MTADQSDGSELEELEDRLRSVLQEHPVRLAVLFGSTVRGERHPQSDVDVAVEFESDVEDTFDAQLSVIADVTSALGRDDVDVALVRNLRPRVGRRAFSEGYLLVGTEERYDRHRSGFERQVEEQRDRASPAERFDALVERIDRAID